MFDIALRNQLIVVNPCTLLTKIAKTTRKTIVKDAIGKFYKLKTAILELYKDDPFWRGFFLFCLYGRRKGEVASLKWENIDLENDVYYLIDTKNGNDYKKPLPLLVKEAITQIPTDRYGLVFASPKTGESIKNTDRQKMKLDKFVGFDDFKLHGTRHISGSALEELGANSDIIKDHLTHKRDGVTYKNYVTYDTYINSCKALELLESIKEDYEF
ncbi:tyrosine-type recombinase/integrase [Campylobacter concisus]|nr:tyrosine-type recombinase/integrase [Campylobacter concisus]